jgi:hypothetical protein
MQKTSLFILIITLLGFLHCQKRVITSTSLGSIAGIVYTVKDNIPLKDVTVRLVGTPLSVQTDSTGRREVF